MSEKVNIPRDASNAAVRALVSGLQRAGVTSRAVTGTSTVVEGERRGHDLRVTITVDIFSDAPPEAS